MAKSVFMFRCMPYKEMDCLMYCVPLWLILLSLQGISGYLFDVDLWAVDYCWLMNNSLTKKLMFIDIFKIPGKMGQNSIQNIFCNTCTLLEQPWLTYTVWSKCNVLCVLCAQGTGASLLFVTRENTDSTWFDVLPVDCDVVVSVWYSVLVYKSQNIQQQAYNCARFQTSVALEVNFLAL
jgi:hypothetical protein